MFFKTFQVVGSNSTTLVTMASERSSRKFSLDIDLIELSAPLRLIPNVSMRLSDFGLCEWTSQLSRFSRHEWSFSLTFDHFLALGSFESFLL